MIDVNKLLTQVVSGISGTANPQGNDQFAGNLSRPSDRGMPARSGGSRWPSAQQMSDQAHGLSGYGGAIGTGAIAGGLASLLFGSKRIRKVAGSAVQVGAVAVIGGLAYKAYQNYRQGKPIVPQSITDMLADVTRSRDPGVAQQPAIRAWIPPQDQSAGVSKLLLRSMIAAASADGHLDAAEYDRIRQQLATSNLNAEEQLFLTQLIMRPSTIEELAAEATTPELGAEVYAAARLAIDPDDTAERDFLDRLAAALKLDSGLRAHLDAIGGSTQSQAA
jgi:uncharacterized membrane protein YebE (DUF533 family)